MSALVPSDAVALLYRRYLKAANTIPNVTLRMLLLQQIRSGFARNMTICSPAAQHELVEQAHKDLQILEDERLARTLYINRLGLVSCLDWEVRRTEYHFRPQVKYAVIAFLSVWYVFFFMVFFYSKKIDKAHPDIASMVDSMRMRLEAGSAEEMHEMLKLRAQNNAAQHQQRVDLEERIFASFYNVPRSALSLTA